jgi:glutathione peroxidase
MPEAALTPESRTESRSEAPAELSAIPFRTADGRETSLSAFRGKVLLVVNVASKCGLTPQYDGLEALHERRRDQGFSVLGFPANEFAGQEPGSDSEIQEFCRLSYGVTFPVFAKIAVKGAMRHPLYDSLIAAAPAARPKPGGSLKEKLRKLGLLGEEGEIMWNFEKFLIGRDGRVAARFAPDVVPEDETLLEAIEAELAKPEPPIEGV